MAWEIERKFLVVADQWRGQAPGVEYRQGYLCRTKGRTVRVRTAADRGFLTIKGEAQGISRPEYEYEIPLVDAEQMLTLCEGFLVEKVRHRVEFGGWVWEVDEFRGLNTGLIVAEIELPRADATFDLPPWVGTEVTSDPRYANSRLSEIPYTRWR